MTSEDAIAHVCRECGVRATPGMEWRTGAPDAGLTWVALAPSREESAASGESPTAALPAGAAEAVEATAGGPCWIVEISTGRVFETMGSAPAPLAVRQAREYFASLRTC